MRISFFTQWWPPEPANLVASLAVELASRGHSLDVVTGHPNYPTGHIYPGHRLSLRTVERSSGLRIVRVPLFPSHDRSAPRRFANYASFAVAASTIGLVSVRRSHVAYVYHPPITTAWPARLQRLIRHVPFVLHVQDLWPESVVQSGMIRAGRSRQLVERALGRASDTTYRAASHIIVISEGFKHALIQRGVHPNKISVVRNWADESIFKPGNPSAEIRAAISPANALSVLYAGNIGDYQSLDSVVLAASRFSGSLHLAIVGDGIARDRLELLIRLHRISNVSLLDRRPTSEMPALLAAADVHLVSLADRGFLASTIPGKTQVAFASAKPVLMAVRGEAARLVREADAGIACDPSERSLTNAFAALVATPRNELRAHGESGRRFYDANLSLAQATGQIEQILSRSASLSDNT